MRKKNKIYILTLSNGKTYRLVTSDYRKAFSWGQRLRKKHGAEVTVANVVEMDE